MKTDILKDKPLKAILIFMLPIALGNIIQQIYGMMDSVVLGRFLGETALAAVGTTTPIAFLVLGFTNGITSGFSILSAQRFGAKDTARVRKSIFTSYFLSAIVTVVLTVLCVCTVDLLLGAMNVPDTLYPAAKKYITVVYIGIFANVTSSYFTGLLRSFGNSKFPLYVLVITAVLNVIADFILIGKYRLGVEATAWTNVTAQFVASVICFIYLLKKFPQYRLHKEDIKVSLNEIGSHLAAGLPMALQFSVTAIGVMVVQGALNLLGDTAIAGYTSSAKIENLLNQTALALAVACSTFCAQNLGAGEYKRIKQGLVASFLVALGIAAFNLVICLTLGKYMLLMFIENPSEQLTAYSVVYLNVFAASSVLLNMLFLVRPSLQSLNKNLTTFMGGVLNLSGRVIVTYTLVEPLGYLGVCLAGPIAWFMSSVPMLIILIFTVKKLLKKDAALQLPSAS